MATSGVYFWLRVAYGYKESRRLCQMGEQPGRRLEAHTGIPITFPCHPVKSAPTSLSSRFFPLPSCSFPTSSYLPVSPAIGDMGGILYILPSRVRGGSPAVNAFLTVLTREKQVYSDNKLSNPILAAGMYTNCPSVHGKFLAGWGQAANSH